MEKDYQNFSAISEHEVLQM